jgi:hypothetical protein
MKRRLFGMPIVAALCAVVFLGLAVSAGAYSNNFDTDTAGWFDNGGTITKQPSGYDNDVYAEGIPSASDGFHARLDRGGCVLDGTPPGGIGPSLNCSGPFTRWGGYGSTWNGTYTTQVDIYLDAAYANNPLNEDSPNGNLGIIGNEGDKTLPGTRFDYVSAINNSSGNHLRDFGFVVGTGQAGNTCTGWTVNAQTNTTRDSAFPDDLTKDPECIDTSGWYTFKHTFFENTVTHNLNVTMEIIPVVGPANADWTWTVESGDADTGEYVADHISTVGCNRYGWFTDQEIFGLPIDNAKMEGGCAAATIMGGQILPTGTTCQQYGDANPNQPPALGTVQYTLNKGKINSVAPGVFFYYATISGVEDQTFTITQSDNGSTPFIPVQHGQVILYDTNCNVLKWTPDSDANGVVTGTLPSTGTFIISVKYSAAALKGESDPGTTVIYTIDDTTVALQKK